MPAQIREHVKQLVGEHDPHVLRRPGDPDGVAHPRRMPRVRLPERLRLEGRLAQRLLDEEHRGTRRVEPLHEPAAPRVVEIPVPAGGFDHAQPGPAHRDLALRQDSGGAPHRAEDPGDPPPRSAHDHEVERDRVRMRRRLSFRIEVLGAPRAEGDLGDGGGLRLAGAAVDSGGIAQRSRAHVGDQVAHRLLRTVEDGRHELWHGPLRMRGEQASREGRDPRGPRSSTRTPRAPGRRRR